MIVDCFGLMHAADQRTALAERASRIAAGGVLLLQYHSLSTIIGGRQWNALRHGHYAYYSTTALTAMLAAVGFSPVTAWQFSLYGGTVLLAASRDGERNGGPTPSCRRSLPRTPASASAIPALSPACSAMCALTLRLCMTGWRRNGPPDVGCSAMAPRQGPSRCCAKREWIAGSCRR